MTANATRIRSELEKLGDLPTPVRSWIVEEGLDATDDEAVWVWALLEHRYVDAETRFRLKSMAEGSARPDERSSLAVHPDSGRVRGRRNGVSLATDVLDQAASGDAMGSVARDSSSGSASQSGTRAGRTLVRDERGRVRPQSVQR